jgi:ADP-heptose:LPS heptosyltransferase
VNIGDAVFSQALAAKLRELFPEAVIDLVVGKGAFPLIKHSQDVSNARNLYTTAPFPCSDDIDAVNQLLGSESYDILLNFCPFLDGRKLIVPKNTIDLPYLTAGAMMMREQSHVHGISNVVTIFQKYIVTFFGDYSSVSLISKQPNAYIALSEHSILQAKQFIIDNGISNDQPIVLINPDTSSSFSRVPLSLQVEIIRLISQEPVTILLGAGHADVGIENRILEKLDKNIQVKIIIVPKTVSLEMYAALIDCCDVFITGDTGPLHIAAAEKRCTDSSILFRNKTSIVSIFGATPNRLYGYASDRVGYQPAFQNAPSFTFNNNSPLRTLLYLNKNFIPIKSPEIFFDGISAEQIVSVVQQSLNR